MFDRRQSIAVDIEGVCIGGDNPIAIQSMTNTETSDVLGTVAQIRDLVAAGSELVRVTVNDEKAARAVPLIVEILRREAAWVPVIGDFHYNGHILLSRFPECAQALSKYRINPGNVGMGRHWDTNFRSMVEVAVRYRKPVRIGVNWGSLDQRLLGRLMDENSRRPEPHSAAEVVLEAMVASALESAAAAEDYGLAPEAIVLSAKVSSVPDLVRVYRELASRCRYALHLGLTEAGMGTPGITASAAGLAILLAEGIGDTIRVSLTPSPGGKRSEEVEICRQILQALGLRQFMPRVSACPGCGRTTSVFFQELALRIQGYIQERMKEWKTCYPGVEGLKIAVMGCIVNGPGESKHADIGISLPGSGEEPKAPVFVDGRHVRTLSGPDLAEQFTTMLDEYVRQRYSRTGHPPVVNQE